MYHKKINTKYIMLIIIIALLAFNLKILFELYKNSYQFKCLSKDSLNSIYSEINKAIDSFEVQDEYPVIFKTFANPELDFYSYIIAISKKKEIYIIYGWQTTHLESNSDTSNFVPLYSIKRNLSFKEFEKITEQMNSASIEYMNQQVYKLMREYPPNWNLKTQIYYNKKIYTFDPSILGNSYIYKDNIDLPQIAALYQVMIDMKNEYEPG